MRMRLLSFLLVLSLFGSGCAQPGSENSARKHLDEEFRKWMAGGESDVMPIASLLDAPPIGYEVYSVTPTHPNPLLSKDAPAYQFKVSTRWVSQAHTEMTKTHTYVLTWNADEEVWDVAR